MHSIFLLTVKYPAAKDCLIKNSIHANYIHNYTYEHDIKKSWRLSTGTEDKNSFYLFINIFKHIYVEKLHPGENYMIWETKTSFDDHHD